MARSFLYGVQHDLSIDEPPMLFSRIRRPSNLFLDCQEALKLNHDPHDLLDHALCSFSFVELARWGNALAILLVLGSHKIQRIKLTRLRKMLAKKCWASSVLAVQASTIVFAFIAKL